MEVASLALERRLYWKLFVYPTKNRFSKESLMAELEGQGITVGEDKVERFFGEFIYGVGDKS